MCSQEKRKLVLDRVREESKKIYGDKLDKIFLFGSYARGENTEESDIDIMIVLRCSREEAGGFRKKHMRWLMISRLTKMYSCQSCCGIRTLLSGTKVYFLFTKMLQMMESSFLDDGR